jgi:hypothetical protein
MLAYVNIRCGLAVSPPPDYCLRSGLSTPHSVKRFGGQGLECTSGGAEVGGERWMKSIGWGDGGANFAGSSGGFQPDVGREITGHAVVRYHRTNVLLGSLGSRRGSQRTDSTNSISSK